MASEDKVPEADVSEAPEVGKVSLDRMTILGKVELQIEELYVPEWKGFVWVRELTAYERDEYEHSLMLARRVGTKVEIKPNFTNVKARMAVKTLVDKEGKRLFKDNDVIGLGKLSSKALNRVVDVAERLSGLSKEDVEGLEGNSEKDQGESLPLS